MFFGLSDRFGRFLLIVAYLLLMAVLWAFARSEDLTPPDPLSPGQGTTAGAAELLVSALVFAVAVGVLAAAVVDVLKRMTGVRGRFHIHELQQFLAESAAHRDDTDDADHTAPGPRDTAWTELQRALGGVWPIEPDRGPVPRGLAGAKARAGQARARRADRRFSGHRRHDHRYFFDLPLEQLMGQVGAALEVALSKPREYYALLECFAGQTARDELELLRSSPGAATEPGSRPEQNIVRAQAVVHERMQRGLDATQVIIGHRWRWFVRGLAATICAVLGLVVVEATGANGLPAVLLWLTSAGPGAFFAWLARDASAAVERWRR